MNAYPKTPAERRREKRLYAVAASIREAIVAIADQENAAAKVPQVFREVKATPSEKGDAFWLLDEKPGQFCDYQVWHPVLRRCRNHPDLGREMFATFR